MTVTTFATAPVIQTPNATMRTLASPSRLGSALAVWHVILEPGAAGPDHRMDADQVYVVLSGQLTITIDGITETASAGDSAFVPAGALRRIANPDPTPIAITVAMPAGAHVSTLTDSHHGELPWAR